MKPSPHSRRAEFQRINRLALEVLPILLHRWLPDGRVEGAEFVALNPRRDDRQPGSFKVNILTGRWADFAVDDARGGDVISLVAYVEGIRQGEAARRLAQIVGVARDD